MNEEMEAAAGVPSGPPAWAQALNDLERGLLDASHALAVLRQALEGDAAASPVQGAAPGPARTAGPPLEVVFPEPLPKQAPPPAGTAPAVHAPEPPPPETSEPDVQTPVPSSPAPAQERALPGEGGGQPSAFDQLWDRIEREKMEKSAQEMPERSGLDLLPQQYLMTVEDREGKVDLVSLHRGLSGIPDVNEISLVSYANGVPVISLRVGGELDPELLGEAAGKALGRQCEVIQQDTGRLYLRMKGSQSVEGGHG